MAVTVKQVAVAREARRLTWRSAWAYTDKREPVAKREANLRFLV